MNFVPADWTGGSHGLRADEREVHLGTVGLEAQDGILVSEIVLV